MQIFNTAQKYGWVSIVLHWSMAIAVIATFGLGFWMVDLSYYDEWYRTGPFIHKSVGILLAGVLVFRLSWRLVNIKPADEKSLKTWERLTAHLVHGLLYAFLFAIVISGYLISTADGRTIEVFNWFEVPALGKLFENQEDLAGWVHEYLAYGLIAFVGLHALAALKHHFIHKDRTLKKMLGL